MFVRRIPRWAAPALSALLLTALASCSAGTKTLAPAKVTDPPKTSEAPIKTTTVPEPVDTVAAVTSTQAPAAPNGAVTSIDDVKSATVQVLAQGSYRDPEAGAVSTFGSGSGFIVDPSGIVVTNNHVVTGAGAVSVLVGGGTDEIPAKILGVSECNDLAVLQLADPGTYPYLTWFEGDVTPPTEVYAAGFPLGDPEYTVTKGIVSKAKANGDTSWASVRNVIEHDANIQHGNSGGPLVNPQGQLLGVNYRGDDPGGTVQFFAISRDIAQPVVELLKKGDAEYIGVNGRAFANQDTGLAGVWVGAVAAGSPASKAGLAPGDVITSLNGVQLSSGTMKEYCSVLRTADVGGAIAIEIVRFDTETVLKGELNGTPLVESFSFAQTAETEQPLDSGTTYAQYVSITDDSGRLVVEIPSTWTDYTTNALDTGFGFVPGISASPNFDDPATPGMLMYAFTGVSADTPPDEFLDSFGATGCTEDSRDDYSDSISFGRYSLLACDDGSLIYNIVANSLDRPDIVVVLRMLAWTDADLDAVDHMIGTFIVS